jgi:ribosomal protein S18 acetylase RimI-like enzyme
VENITIRRLKAEDGGEIGKIYAAITRDPSEANFERLVRDQAGKPEDASFVAEHAGKVVGYMISSILTGIFGIKKSAWISMMGVHPRFMGQGIGERLAEDLFQYAKGQGLADIYTSVRWDSTDLLSFCKTLGFDRSNFINLRKKL